MQLSITGLLYVIALAMLAGLKPLFRILIEAVAIGTYVGFLAIAYAVTWATVNVKAAVRRRGPIG